MISNNLEDKIYSVLEPIIPFEGVEIIYTKHYIKDVYDGEKYLGYDEKNHLLLIRDCMCYYCDYERSFDLDVDMIIEALEKEGLDVSFDKIIMIDESKTYKFYLSIKKLK